MAKAKKKTEYYYVLVFTEEGPVYVTSVERNWAHWSKNETPMHFSKETAEQLAIGLSWNENSAVVVCSIVELPKHPYYYELGRFKWVNNVTEDF